MTDEQRAEALANAVEKLGAVPDGFIPGLWYVPGYPELTTGQLLSIAYRPSDD